MTRYREGHAESVLHKRADPFKSLTSAKTHSEDSGGQIPNQGTQVYSLQTAIESMIDIAFHMSVKSYNHAPGDARDAFRALTRNGAISNEDFEIFTSMVSFRNRMVHLYQTISDERVYEFCTTGLKDFEPFIDRITVLTAAEN